MCSHLQDSILCCTCTTQTLGWHHLRHIPHKVSLFNDAWSSMHEVSICLQRQLPAPKSSVMLCFSHQWKGSVPCYSWRMCNMYNCQASLSHAFHLQIRGLKIQRRPCVRRALLCCRSSLCTSEHTEIFQLLWTNIGQHVRPFHQCFLNEFPYNLNFLQLFLHQTYNSHPSRWCFRSFLGGKKKQKPYANSLLFRLPQTSLTRYDVLKVAPQSNKSHCLHSLKRGAH